MRDTVRYWFPAKTYGWGWGLPSTWEGWMVLVLYAGAIGGIVHFFPPRAAPTEFGLGVTATTLILVVICWLKGEPPRWRWGGR